MPYTLVRARVEEFSRWRRAFEEQAEAREEAGSRGGHLFRAADDPDTVVAFLAWDDLKRARSYLESEEAREAWRAGGLDGEPETLYLEELGRPSR